MIVVVIYYKGTMAGSVVKPDDMDAEKVVDLYYKANGFSGFPDWTYHELQCMSLQEVLEKLEPCAKNMTMFLGQDHKEVVAKRDEDGFHFQKQGQASWEFRKPNSVAELETLLNGCFGVSCSESVARRLWMLPISDTD